MSEQSGHGAGDAAREMREHGRHAIWVASDLMRKDS